jgi:hypothetical protein
MAHIHAQCSFDIVFPIVGRLVWQPVDQSILKLPTLPLRVFKHIRRPVKHMPPIHDFQIRTRTTVYRYSNRFILVPQAKILNEQRVKIVRVASSVISGY